MQAESEGVCSGWLEVQLLSSLLNSTYFGNWEGLFPSLMFVCDSSAISGWHSTLLADLIRSQSCTQRTHCTLSVAATELNKKTNIKEFKHDGKESDGDIQSQSQDFSDSDDEPEFLHFVEELDEDYDESSVKTSQHQIQLVDKEESLKRKHNRRYYDF